MKKTIYEDYEQMNIGSIDTRSLGIPTRKRGFCTKKRVLFLLCFMSISIIIIFFIFRKSKKSSTSSEPNNNTNTNTNSLENELNALTSKENELRNENNKLNSQKESLQKENEKMAQQINELMEENKRQNDKKNDISKDISDKEEKIKEFENKLKEAKNKFDELSKQEKEQNEKLNENNNKIKSLEQKIAELEKELKGNESNEKKEEEKKEEEKKEEEKKEEDKKDEEKKEEEKKEEEKKDEEKKEDDKKEDDNKEEDKEQEINPQVRSRILSKIIVDPKYLDILDKWFGKELKYKLLYRATDEQYSAEAFHNLVDKIKNTIIFIKDINNFIYGGFTRKTWDGNRIYKTDQHAIVFNLDKEIYYKINDPNHAIFCDPDNLAIFGEGDILLGKKSIESSFPKTYGSSSENKKNELTLGFDKLSPLEIEVFHLS